MIQLTSKKNERKKQHENEGMNKMIIGWYVTIKVN